MTKWLITCRATRREFVVYADRHYDASKRVREGVCHCTGPHAYRQLRDKPAAP